MALWFVVAAIVVGLPIFLIVQFTNLTERIRRLEHDVRILRQKLEGDVPPTVETVRPTPATHPAMPASGSQASTPPPSILPFPKIDVAPSRTREEWEALIGGKLLNRIGALALIIGVGFFLKYAFDQNWLNEISRVGIGAVTGGALMFGAHRAKGRGFEIFSQGLLGAGMAILYLSAFAAFNFYHLVSQPVAFLLMSVVTVVAFTEALVADAFAVALLGWLGGFLTPLLVSTGEANEIGLFTYLALLDLGMFAVMWKKERWHLLHILSLIATYAFFISWYSSQFETSAFWLTLMFATIFWGIFYANDILDIELNHVSFLWIRRIQRALNTVVFSSILYVLFEDHHHAWTGPAFLVLTVVYGLSTFAIRRGKPEAAWEIGLYASATALLLMSFAGIQFDHFEIVFAWTIEAFAVFYIGVRWHLPYAQYGSFAIFLAAFIRLLATPHGIEFMPSEGFTVIFNQRCLAFVLLTAALWIGGFLARPSGIAQSDLIADIMIYAGSFVFFLLLSFETSDGYRLMKWGAKSEELSGMENLHQLTLSGIWLVYSMILMTGGIWRRSSALRRFAIGVFAFTILKIFIYDLSFLETLYRIFSFLGLGVILLAVSFFYQKYKSIILGP